MCTCIKDAEKKFDELFREKLSAKNIEIAEVREQGFTTLPLFIMNGPLRFFHPYEVKYIAKKKDGYPEKRTLTFKTNLISSYCCICGEKYELKDDSKPVEETS